MADSDILKQIALLNPRIINGNEIDSVNDFIINSDTSSPQERNQDETMDHPNTEEENDILNLWSSTKIFFDPFDPSKINPVTQAQTNQTLSEVHKLSEREIDRQRYARLKQQQQSIYINRGRHNMVDDGKGGTNHEVLHLSNLNDVQLRQFLMNGRNKETEKVIENNLLEASTSNANTTHTIATSQGFMNNIPTPMSSEPKLNTSTLSPIDYQMTMDDDNKVSDNKNKDLYSQLLNSINTGKGKASKAADTAAILSKTNDSRNREIAEKKKRRSAATMRCRERKKNQLQKKEQYIKYLENQILFLNGSILHMSNEIHWLRRSFLDQYGEQSLKNIYMKNGFKDVNFSNILYPGSSPSPSSFASSNLLSPDMSINGSPNLNADQSPKQKSSPLLPQQSPFLTPVSSAGASNTNSILSSFSPPPSTGNKSSKNTSTSSITPSQNMASLIQKSPTSQASSDMSTNFIGSYNTSSQPSSSNVNDKNNTATASDLFNHLDMETLNEFANLTKEQREVLLKILEKQKELSNDKPEESSVPSASSRNFMNIAHDHESQSELSKPSNSLLNIVSSSNNTPVSGTSFHPLTSNLINTFNGQQDINSLSFHSSSMAQTSSVPVSTLQTSQPNALSLSTANNSLLTSFNTQTNVEKETSTNIITTTADTQNTDYINLDNLIYYI